MGFRLQVNADMKRNIAMLVLAASCAAFADRVELKSGSFLTGTVKSVSKEAVVFASDDLGDVTIKVANIAKLDVGARVVQRQDLNETREALSVADGAFVAGARPLDMADVKAIDPVAETWHGNVTAAYTGKRGNTYEDTGAVRAEVTRKWEKDRFLARAAYDYGKTGTSTTDNKKTTDEWEAEVKHDHFWFAKTYTYEDVLWERDTIKNLNARYTLGLGAGYQWLDDTAFAWTGRWSFNQEVGANWVKEEWVDNDDAKAGGFAAVRYAHHLLFVPKGFENCSLFHNLKLIPEVDDWDKYLVRADIGFQVKLIGNFTFDARIEWDYDSKPASDMKKDDFLYLVGLGYKW